MKRVLTLFIVLYCAAFSSCFFRGSSKPEVHDYKSAPLGKPLCVDRIIFYKDGKFAQVYGDTDDYLRIKSEVKVVLTQKLRDAGFAVEECDGSSEQLHLEIGGYHRSSFLGLVHHIIARVRVYDHPLRNPEDFECPAFEITNLEEPIAGTSEAQVKKTVNALIDKIVAELKKKAEATNP